MTTAQIVEMSVTNNSLSKDYPHTNNHAKPVTDTPGFKPFTNVPLTVSSSLFTSSNVLWNLWNRRTQTASEILPWDGKPIILGTNSPNKFYYELNSWLRDAHLKVKTDYYW